jgi:hypothetical protein
MKEIAELIQAIAALLYPIIIFTIILIFKGEIKSLVSRLKKGKLLGQELELSESLNKLDESVSKAVAEVIALPRERNEDEQGATNKLLQGNTEDASEIQHVLELARTSPKVALMSLATEIEKEVREIILSYGYAKETSPLTLGVSTKVLDKNNILPQSTVTALQDFQRVRNPIVHGYNASIDDILRAIDSGIVILKTLKSIPREINVIYHPGIEIYSDEKCKQVREGVKGVILETISPGGAMKSYRIFPTTRTHFQKGLRVAWEWNNELSWNETWYKDPDSGEIKSAWLGSMEFIGRHIE